MCSITDQAVAAPSRAARLAALVAHRAELGALIAAELTGAGSDDGPLDLGSVPVDALADLATTMLTDADRGAAVATVLVGQVTAVAGPATGTLIAGTYASPNRWLQVEAGLAPGPAKTVIARARDLREHSGAVQEAWLAGDVSGDSVRELTSGITGALKPVRTTRVEKERLRAEAIEVLLPLATAGTPADVCRAVGRLRLLAESAHEEQRAIEAYDEQSLTCVQVGDLFRLEAWLTKENAAAAMTVIDQHARRTVLERDPDVVHDPACPLASPAPPLQPGSAVLPAARWCSCGASAAAGVVSKDDWPHAMGVAFGEIMTGQLSAGAVGTHHGVAPHVTVTVDVADLAAGLGGTLAMPGQDEPVVLSSDAVRRILCDASITPVVVEKLLDLEAAAGRDELATLLRSTAIAVLFVGRTERTVTPRQRRALEVRDRHCIFPGCRAHPRRCQAHHVVEWENGGSTDIDNLALLCVRHHTSVHEGGWTISRTPGTSPYENGCWTLAPPRPRP